MHPNHGTTLSFRWYAKRYAGTFLVGEHDSEDPLPKRSGSSLGSPSSHLLDGQEGLSAGLLEKRDKDGCQQELTLRSRKSRCIKTHVDVNLMSTERSASLPNQTDDVENDDDGKSQPSLWQKRGKNRYKRISGPFRDFNGGEELGDSRKKPMVISPAVISLKPTGQTAT